MAFTTTTLSAAVATTDKVLQVTSATGFAAGNLVKIDEEFFKVTTGYVSGTTIPVTRGLNGSAVVAHVSGANAVTGLASDFATPNSTVSTAYALAGRRRKVIAYGASGAITLPTAGEDVLAILDGTSALAMTIAAPTKDLDGSILMIAGNGVANHTIQFTGGLSGAGTSYDVITVNSSAPIAVQAIAINGLWTSFVATPMAGTVTNITGTIG